MNLSQLRAEWTQLGTTDPLWAVLSDSGKRGGRWDPEEFFATGRKDVREVLTACDASGVAVQRGRALDFGCGVGRLSQALAVEFEEVVGVDIAESMVVEAQRFDQSNGRCSFVVNVTDDLARFDAESFDFMYSHIVFQHMEPRYSLAYIGEFTRLLRAGGVCVFQIPVPNGRPRVADIVRRRLPWVVRLVQGITRPNEPIIEMYGVPEQQVREVLARGGVEIFRTTLDPNAARGTHGVVFYGRKMPSVTA